MYLNDYEEFKFKKINTSLLLNKFTFQNDNFKKFFIAQEKSNYDFYYFIGKSLKDVKKLSQIGLCGGYYLGLLLLVNDAIDEIFLFDTIKDNKKILRLTKNNLLSFNKINKNYYISLETNDLLSKIDKSDSEIIIIYDVNFAIDNIDEILNMFFKNKFANILVIDNLKDDINFEYKIKNFCIIRNIAFEKFIKRNNAIILRKDKNGV